MLVLIIITIILYNQICVVDIYFIKLEVLICSVCSRFSFEIFSAQFNFERWILSRKSVENQRENVIIHLVAKTIQKKKMLSGNIRN